MSLKSAIMHGRLLSLVDVQNIFDSTLIELLRDAEDNSGIYAFCNNDCPGESSCSAQDLLIAVATASMEYFAIEPYDAFECLEVYAMT